MTLPIGSVRVRESLLSVMVMAYNEASGLDIKLQVPDQDFIFLLKDERTINRVCYCKVPFIEAGEMLGDLELFDKKMRELIAEANKFCGHERVREDIVEGAPSWFLCDDCDTMMEPVGDGTFIVKTSW